MDKIIVQKKTIWQRYRWLIIGVVAVLALYLLLAGSGSSQGLSLDRSSLLMKPVEEGIFRETIAADGSVQPVQTVIIDALVGGKVAEKLTEDGANLTAGQAILRLDNSDLQLDILNKETAVYDLINNIQSTRITLNQTKVNRRDQLADIIYQRQEAERAFTVNEKLFAQDAVSEQEWIKVQNTAQYWREKDKLIRDALHHDSLFAINQIRQMEESLDRVRQNLALMRTKLDDLVVRAPIDGQLTAFTAELGQLISTGQNIGQIDVLDSYKVRVLVDEHYIGRIVKGQEAQVTVNGTEYTLEVYRVFPTVTNNQFTADLRFTGPVPNNLKRGQNMAVRLALSEEHEAILLPRGGFFQSTGGQWVFALDEDGQTARRRAVRLGKQNTTHFEVLEGLKPGETVIVSSYAIYQDYEQLHLN